MLTKNQREKISDEMMGARAQFINDINLVSMMLSLEVNPTAIIKHGALVPSLNVRKTKKIDAQTIASAKETYKKNRLAFFKMLGLSADKVKPLADHHVTATDRIMARIRPAKTFFNVFKKIEWDHELTLVPVMIYHPSATYASYDVVEKKRKSTESTLKKDGEGVK